MKETIDWVEIKMRPITDDEREEIIERDGECISDEVYICELPDDGEEVLITTTWGEVRIDTFVNDADGVYFEDTDAECVVAWAHKPKGFKVGDF